MTEKRKRRNFKLVVKKMRMTPEDDQAHRQLYLHMQALHTAAKKASPEVREMLKKEMQECRSDYSGQTARRFYRATLSLGPHKLVETYPFYPGLGEDVKPSPEAPLERKQARDNTLVNMKDDLVRKLTEKRSAFKKTNRSVREFNGIRYDMLEPVRKVKPIRVDPPGFVGPIIKKPFENFGGGRVFEAEGSILKMPESAGYKDRIFVPKKPYDKKSKYVGVELEFLCKLDAVKLNKILMDNNLAGHVYVMRDASLRTDPDKPDYLSHEVTLIAKQQNAAEVIAKVCKVLKSPEVGGYANNSCGLHVHLDMRSRNVEICYANLYYALPILIAMNPAMRSEGVWAQRYCSPNVSDKFGSGGTSDQGSRYSAINCNAYKKHQTLELRLHSGSLNSKKIINWVNLLVNVVERDTKLGYQITNVHDLAPHFGVSQEIIEYVDARICKFKDRKIDTLRDEIEEAV